MSEQRSEDDKRIARLKADAVSLLVAAKLVRRYVATVARDEQPCDGECVEAQAAAKILDRAIERAEKGDWIL